MLYISAAQRVGVLFTAKKDTSQNYAVVAAMDQELFDVIPDDLIANSTSHLIYDTSKSLPQAKEVDEFEPLDDFGLVPTDGQKVLEEPVQSVTLDVDMKNLGNGKVSLHTSFSHYVKLKS
jgi:iron transport multicopper oxidase